MFLQCCVIGIFQNILNKLFQPEGILTAFLQNPVNFCVIHYYAVYVIERHGRNCQLKTAYNSRICPKGGMDSLEERGYNFVFELPTSRYQDKIIFILKQMLHLPNRRKLSAKMNICLFSARIISLKDGKKRQSDSRLLALPLGESFLI